MKKIRVAVVGYGNIGRAAIAAIRAAEDMELAGLVRRSVELSGDEARELQGVQVVDDIAKLADVQVAVLCSPSRMVPEMAKSILERGISTVDSYDIHSGIWDLRESLLPVAQKSGAVAIVSVGWDPGSNSLLRALFEAMTPKGITYTNFGPGMSMGHSVAAKAVAGVKDALSMTIPLGTGVHRRMVYVELEAGYDFAQVAEAIKNDPYFVNDETYVKEVASVEALKDTGHGVNMQRKGVSGSAPNQLLEFDMRINNPALTAQMMVSAARAATRLQPGAYTLIEVPVADMLPGSKEDIIRRLV